MSFLSSLIPKLPEDMNTNYSNQDTPAISVITFLVSVSLIFGIAYRVQLTFHHCLLSSVRSIMSIYQHQLGAVSFVLCFYYCVSFFLFYGQFSIPSGPFCPVQVLCYRCVVSSC